jgi:putative copper export protein
MPGAIPLLFPVVRGLIAATLLLLIGVPVAAALVRRHGPRPALPARETMDGWFERLPGLLAWFLLICSLMRGALQLLSFTDPGTPIAGDLVRAVLLEGSWGTAWIAQSVAAFALLAISWLWRREPRRLTVAMLLLLLIAAVAEGGLGHGADELWPGVLGRIVHAVHLLGSGLWLGTLAILALVVLPSLRGDDAVPVLAAVVRGFSLPARIGVVLVITSGVTATWRYSGGDLLALPGALWGQLLLIKGLVVVGAMLLGGWNWRRVTPALTAGTPQAAATLRRAVAAELLLGAVALLLTAWLIGSPLPVPAE